MMVPIMLAGWKLVPPLLKRVERACNDELSLLLVLTICMVVAALTEAVGLSLALGAFLAGLLLGNSEFAHILAQQTFGMRDAFVAIFFVTVGMLIDPATWASSWRLIILIVALVIVAKFIVWTGVVRIFGYTWNQSLRTGIGLTQIGEFSFILAMVSRDAGIITPEMYHATLAASLITILANATFFKFLPVSRSAA
jgi:monovalent cation:H+ antiporter-2, CPA2 family